VTSIFSANNRLFVLARQGRCQPSALMAIAVVPVLLALVIASQVAARLLLRPLFPNGVPSVADLIAEIIGFLAIYLGLWVWLRFWIKRPFWSLGFEHRHVVQRLLRGALVAGFMVVAMAGLTMIPGASLAPGEIRTKGLAVMGTGLLTLLATTVQSSAEEALFRGWLLSAIGSRYRPWIGILVSSLLFATAHLLNGPTLLAWLNLFFFGTFAAMWSLAEGGLWGASAWHTAWNWVEGGLLGMVVDRSVSPGLFVSIQTKGPTLITGGAFGPDGGLAFTAVLLIGISVLVVRTRYALSPLPRTKPAAPKRLPGPV
jgi:membrane protease YdiL (CAAX protease family)